MHNENEPILIKPQELYTFLLNDLLKTCPISVIIKNGKHENCISIGRRDIFFDKEGNCTGEGIVIADKKEKK